jgi:hypothetical protein
MCGAAAILAEGFGLSVRILLLFLQLFFGVVVVFTLISALGNK